MVSSQFVGNTAVQGGAIYAKADQPSGIFQVEISSCNLNKNKASQYGSALYFDEVHSNLEFSSITENEVTRYL